MSAKYYITMPNWLYSLLAISIGVVFLLFCTTLIYDLMHFSIKKIPISASRRGFFKKSLDISSLAVAGSIIGKSIYNARFVKLEKVNISIKDLKQGYKIAQLSDIHIGGIIDATFIRDVVKRVNDLKPDIVVITGDLIDVDVKQAKEALDEFKNLNSVYGTYYVVGNHEYFHGVEKIIESVKALGIRVLENENVYIGEKNRGFNLAGVHDLFGYRLDSHKPDIEKALSAKKDSPTILLAHQPKYIEEVKKDVDLVLSGHTHGGQLYPFQLLVKLQQTYVSGLYQHNDDLQIYVNKGTGFWGPPMRLGTTSEITEIIVS